MLAQIDEGTTLIADGDRGTVTIAPDEVSRGEMEKRLATAQRDRENLEVYRDRPGMTADGVRIEVFANIGSLAEARKAVEMGAEGGRPVPHGIACRRRPSRGRGTA